MSFEIFTDTSCSLDLDTLNKYNIKVVVSPIFINGEEFVIKDINKDMPYLYEQMRNKVDVKTSLINTDKFIEAFEPFLKEGKDIFYTGLSGGLSGTYSCAVTAAELLKEDYPERKIMVADSKSVSWGIGLIVIKAAQMRQENKSIEEINDYVNFAAARMNHIIMIDDLYYLKRGGRISSAEAFFGELAKIKPLCVINGEGKVEITGKVSGKKRALSKIVEDSQGLIETDGLIAVAHCGCDYDALSLKEKAQKVLSNEIIIGYVDPVISSHAGPDALALIFIGKEK